MVLGPVGLFGMLRLKLKHLGSDPNISLGHLYEHVLDDSCSLDPA